MYNFGKQVLSRIRRTAGRTHIHSNKTLLSHDDDKLLRLIGNCFDWQLYGRLVGRLTH